MTTLTIEIPDKSEKTIADLIEQLGGKVLKTDSTPINNNAKKLSKKEKEFLKGLEEAVEFINQHQQGKVKAKTIQQLLDEQ